MEGIFGRTLRLLDLGRTALKLRGASSEAVAANARRALVERMGRLRGLPQKLGQMLSMGAGESADDFRELTDAAEPLPLALIQAELEQAWKTPLSKVVESIEPRGKAASLGQVHRAVLRDGRIVAVKVRYPDVAAAVANDLKFLGWLSVPVGNLRRGFDMADYRSEILRDLEEELDYRIEARHQRQFAQFFGELPCVRIPRTVDEYSGENVLVSEWIEGDSIDVVEQGWTAEEKKGLGRGLLQLFCHSVFTHGVFHADPHPGNYRFQRGATPAIVLYDYGSIGRLEETQRLALVRLVLDALRNEREDPFPLFAALGFKTETLAPLRGKLAALCKVILEPFIAEVPYQMHWWKRAERVQDVLGDDRWNFRISGPAQLIFLMRAFHGLVHYLERIGEPVHWTWHCKPILEAQAAAAAAMPLPAPVDPTVGFGALAKFLMIHVTEQGRTKVKVTLPALAVDDLGEYLEEDVRARIVRRGLDLDQLVREVRRGGYAPRRLVDLDEPPRRFRVWLE